MARLLWSRERVQMVSVRGRRLRVATRPGNLVEPPLLLCNGIGASLELLQPLVDAVHPGRAVIRFDLPGIGGSPAPALPYHLIGLPAMVEAMLGQLGHSRVDVLGISWGGGLATQLALARPRLVRRLVLAATGTGVLMVPARPGVLRHMITPRRHRDASYSVQVAGDIYGGGLRARPERARELLRPHTGSGTRRGYYFQLLAGAGWTSLPMLPMLRQPTLLLAGDDDPIIPLVNARIMAQLIARSRLHIYPGGHLELIDRPQLLAPVIEEFLREQDPVAGHKEGRAGL
ncbi:MAG TPA: poly(3-hydroxyalkanoate) depolymerase [Streptosporangiaceae bacterium]|jgi:poly(3-hydroxyalkanoate) depolymerase|nr:poly(3-hydroxyalkanoate) depolymerase [Streptosporangiaceae bacterium]